MVKLQGQPLVSGTAYNIEILRCNICSKRFKAPVTEQLKNTHKYDVSVASTLAIARYSMGLPFYRTERHQAMHGIPLPDATQWDLVKGLYNVVSPIYEELTNYASNGDLVIYDDTTGRILSNKAIGAATHTTAFISENNDHKVHLFFTGTNHAGKNTDKIMARRTTEEPVIAMMDASPSNIPKKLSLNLSMRFILCFCLTHGRRKFFDVLDFFSQECDFVLDVIGEVYKNDAHCKKEKYSAVDRLQYHKQYSAPLMQELYIWLNNQLLYESCEQNSGLGQAVKYMLRHWEPLTSFLSISGAPLDSSWAERAIKIAIRHRRNSLFYKTPKGANVGDCLMSIIYTAEQNGVNPFNYLNNLQRYSSFVTAKPQDWLPWNYQQALSTVNVNCLAA